MIISPVNDRYFVQTNNALNSKHCVSCSPFSCDVFELNNKKVSFNGFSEKKRLRAEANEYFKTSQELKKESGFVIGSSNYAKYNSRVFLRMSKNIKSIQESKFIYYKEMADKHNGSFVSYSEDGDLEYSVIKDNDKFFVTTSHPQNGFCLSLYDEKGNLLAYCGDTKETEEGSEAKIKVVYSGDESVEIYENYKKLKTGEETSSKHFLFSKGCVNTIYLDYTKSNKTSKITADECFKYKKDIINAAYKTYSLSGSGLECSEKEYDFEQGIVGPIITDYKENCSKKDGKNFATCLYEFRQGKLSSVSIQQHLNTSKMEEKEKFFIYDEEEKPVHFYSNYVVFGDSVYDFDESVSLKKLF